MSRKRGGVRSHRLKGSLDGPKYKRAHYRSADNQFLSSVRNPREDRTTRVVVQIRVARRRYQLVEPPDMQCGNRQPDGSWTGMMGQLHRNVSTLQSRHSRLYKFCDGRMDVSVRLDKYQCKQVVLSILYPRLCYVAAFNISVLFCGLLYVDWEPVKLSNTW